MRILSLPMVLLLAACASSGDSRPLTVTELTTVQVAELFAARHGYTDSGHPANLSVENVEVLDPLASREELVEWRRGTMEARAFGIAAAGPDASYVLFRWPGRRTAFRAVLVEGDNAVQVVHSSLVLNEMDWIRVPVH